MTFSKRVGLEPATDLQRRIQTLCREAGFEVIESRMHLIRKETLPESGRLIHVWVHEPGWTMNVPDGFVGTAWEEHASYQMEIRAIIGADGTFEGTIQVLCSAADVVADGSAPTLRTNEIPIQDLPVFLVRVAKQQREIILDRKEGAKGPWRIDGMLWKRI